MSWAAQVRSDLAQDPELVNKKARAGLKRVYIGFESINNETLEALHKTQTKLDIEKAIKTFHEFGVNIHIINVISLIFFHATIDSILLKLLYVL